MKAAEWRPCSLVAYCVLDHGTRGRQRGEQQTLRDSGGTAPPAAAAASSFFF
uniref:Uncharacterized protein n=1 Tax=Physcomitrium patens TaxID=3218 RepID=A0A7I3YZI0_PHYPA